ncbi:hypothetical protein GALMADRAFT_255154 [Galerina marginata CBS 339.88]|uniref:N-acetyltransferase domain-containing protein n=1 Tax=Galerina marginata (strain CBS 339.88) TaxID=685588 RepID=A0A067SH36_GALM3|nr:hypothetical protein GALMADRAFT_255154 [Galerina marginata CBS 339.88]
MDSSPNVVFDYVSPDDLSLALEIEQHGYPPDEAATESSFRLRQSQAGSLFLGAYEETAGSRTLIGYICSTLSPATTLTHDSMSTHVPNSSSVCIHSVCVSHSHRRKGVGLALLKEYITRLERANVEGSARYERVLLIAHDDLRDFYEKAGFEWLGKSNVVHGSKPWFEMRRNLASPNEVVNPPPRIPEENQPIPPGVLEALTRKKDVIPSSRLISDFPNTILDLLDSDDQSGVSVNKYDLLCPRTSCGSIILKKGVGKWVERTSVQMEPSGYVQDDLPPLPTPPETAQWWLITPSPMEFENIGFTRPVQPLVESGKSLKLLTCAECDLGPLGWCEVGGSEFWLACSRVGYRG